MLRLRKAQERLLRLLHDGADLERIAPDNKKVAFYRVLNVEGADPISARSVEYLLAWRFVEVYRDASGAVHHRLGDVGRQFIDHGYACPMCHAVSFNPNDRIHRYCGNCHEVADENGNAIV